jgi:hypothetical protein
MTKSLLKLREKMFHKLGHDETIIEESNLKCLRMDKTDKNNIGLKDLLGFGEHECSTVDYLKCRKNSIYFIEFSDLKASLNKEHKDFEKIKVLYRNKHIDREEYKRFEKDIWNRLLIEITRKIDGSERIFERLLSKLSHNKKQSWKHCIVLVCRNTDDIIVLDSLKDRLTGGNPSKIKIVSTNQLPSILPHYRKTK